MPRTDFIDLSSKESSSIQNHPINTTLDTSLALTIPPPIINQTIPSQGTNVSPLASGALVLSTPLSSPLKPHPYLTSLDPEPFLSRDQVMQQLSQYQDFDRHLEAAFQNT
nr:hypothetical protein [Tanacetum cinerariifolium]